MVEIQTKTEVTRKATFTESDLKALIADHLGIKRDDIKTFSWPLTSFVRTTFPGKVPPEYEITVYLT